MREREKGMGGRKQVQNSRLASSSPCAGCKLLRRRCAHDCIFAPYFPASEPLKFATVHKVFGASNVSKLLQDIPVQHRGDAVSSLVYEANARVRDPIYGCVGAISSLQHQVESLQAQLALAQAEMVNLRMRQTVYLAHQLGQESLQNNTYIGLGKGAAVSTDSSAMSSQKLVECDTNLKAMFNLDVVVDQTNLGSPMWSC
ncbi:hypothetical protein LUZ61_014554 [Rhynchospora tenuis]|uniref:LOB domain-containing protein n=1 Tax=Rhynchospora tenuis TaxID=198213 RepID=A0AAD5WAZ1_9POAL|nr:hypothetical protein LUZ61_014554 [Rhynchospora tenuis]